MSEDKQTVRRTLKLKPGFLWERVKAQTESARQCNALQSIPTDYEIVEDAGIPFLVRILANLARKDEAKQKPEKSSKSSDFNPFLPYDENLFVTDISETHLCLLNKYNAVDYHLLIVTREFEEQESLLTLEDFEAMWAVLAEIDGLVFYNGGKVAGASQRHKHLQLVPLPLAPTGTPIPIDALVATAAFQGTVGEIPTLPFKHALARFDAKLIQYPLKSATATLKHYLKLLQAIDLLAKSDRQVGAYNLLATREWMLIVPRSQESFESISVNALGFAGALLVRNEQQLNRLKECSPVTVLQQVAYAK